MTVMDWPLMHAGILASTCFFLVLKSSLTACCCIEQVWVPITTAAITAVATWNESAPLHEHLKVKS